LVNKQQQF